MTIEVERNQTQRVAHEPAFNRVSSLLRFLLALVFLIASIPKISNPYHFLLNVYKYDLVNAFWGKMIAVFVPWTELIIAVFLLGGFCIRGCLLLASFFLAVFLFAQGYAIARHIDATCACFNLDSQVMISYWTIARDSALFLAAVFAFIPHYRQLRNRA